MVAAVVRRVQPIGILRVGYRAGEIDHAVERVARPNPTVDGFTLGLARWCPVARALERRQRRPEDAQSGRVRKRDDALVAPDDLQGGNFGVRRGQETATLAVPDVVDALEQDHVSGARL